MNQNPSQPPSEQPTNHGSQPQQYSPIVKTKKRKPLIIFLILLSVAGLTGASVLGVMYKNETQKLATIKQENSDDKKQKKDLTKVVANKVSEPEYKTVSSTLGYSVKYDARIYSVVGQVTDPKSDDKYIFGKTYDGKDLEVKRAYSITKFKLKNKNKFTDPEMTVSSNIRKSYFDTIESDPKYKGKTRMEALIMRQDENKKAVDYKRIDTEKVKINGIEYTKITYKYTAKPYGVDVPDKDYVYIAIHNDRPYWVSIVGRDTATDNYTQEFMKLLQSVNLTDVNAQELSSVGKVRLTADQEEVTELPEGTVNILEDLDEDTVLDVVAKNQIATVRIGALGCADVILQIGTGKENSQRVCTAGVGSGSIISEDGYVASNGHVVDLSDSKIVSSYLALSSDSTIINERSSILADYFVAKGMMSPSEKDKLLRDIKAGDMKAASQVSQLASKVRMSDVQLQNKTKKYIIQLSNDPIRLNSERNEWKTTDTNVLANVIDSEVNMSSGGGLNINNPESDIALLKIDKKQNYPVVQLGSVNGVSKFDHLTAIGYPGFVDGHIFTKQRHTYPSVTQGRVTYLAADGGGHTLIGTTVMIAPGNSGGPAFTADGLQAGLNTYGEITCPDSKCFGQGIVRDVKDMKDLISQNNVTLDTDSEVSKEWDEALEMLKNGEYENAVEQLEQSKEQYPANYLADPFIELAKERSGGKTDVSKVSNRREVILWSLIAAMAIAFSSGIGAAAYWIVDRKSSNVSHHLPHYQ